MQNLLHSLSKVQDNRRKQGRRYTLESILALIIMGYTFGCKSFAQIYEFGKNLSPKDRRALGFGDTTPSHPTLTESIKKISPDELERVFSQIAQLDFESNKLKHIAIDGKTIRSTSNSKDGVVHLLSAYAPENSAVLSQAKSKVGGGEIKAAENILPNINIKNAVITGDALFAQEVLSSVITELGGDFLFKVKGNQKRILDDIKQELHYRETQGVSIETSETVSKGHGRVDRRYIEAIEVTGKYFGGWGSNSIKRAAKITRESYNTKTKRTKKESHFIISSLTNKQASAKDLLDIAVKHWAIENNLHRVRDTTYSEDVCTMACNKSQQICAAMRNFAIFLLRKIDTSITKAIRAVMYKKYLFFKLINFRT